jgi:hypothetical protein
VAVWVVLLTHWVAVDRVGVPLQAPAAMDVAIVFSQPEVKRANEGRDERDVRERPAHKVVAAMRGPVDQVLQAGHDEHAGQATDHRRVAIRELSGASLGGYSRTLAHAASVSLVRVGGLKERPQDAGHLYTLLHFT